VILSMQPKNENSKPAAKSCGKAAPWKSPKNGLFHLAWKSAHPADFHFPHSLGCYWDMNGSLSDDNDRKTHNSTSPEINLLQPKNGLDFGVHFTVQMFPKNRGTRTPLTRVPGLFLVPM